MQINFKVQEEMKKKMVEYAPDMCRNIFRLLDLDKSGRISTRELTVLKALMDGFLRLGTSTIIGSPAEKALTEGDEKQLEVMYPDLFKEGGEKPTAAEEATALLMAIFDAIDRDGDCSLQQDEIVAFVTSLMSFLMQHMKIMTLVMADT